MGNFQNFNPNNFAQATAGLIYYLLLAASAFFSISTIYSLIKYSKSRGLAFLVSLAYLAVYFSLATVGIGLLNNIK